ncbi:MAG: cadherin-like domain-containing protein, partial [Acidobacteria bacterium]|nr:cadherin-like domain-containing protein [Acidobacteriota bacterium]
MTPKLSRKRIIAIALSFFVIALFFFVKNQYSTAAGPRPAALFVPAVTATKTAGLQTDANGNGTVNPGDTLRYTVTVTNGGTDAAGVNFNDTIDANTTLVPGSLKVSPIAFDDSYSSIGNVGINVPAANGVLANDLPMNGAPIGATAVNTAGTQGTVALNPDGSFTFKPNAGFEGATTFTYTISNGSFTAQGTVTINVSGMIWFIDNNAGTNGDGRLGTPFNSLANFNAGAADDPGDNIFLYRNTATNYTGGITLLANQKLIGAGATASLATVTGLTPPAFSNALPATGGTRPVLTHTTNDVTVSTGNTIRGLDIQSTGGSALVGTSFNGLNVSEAAVSATNAIGVNLAQASGAAAINVALISVSASGAANGIVLSNTTGSFTVAGTGGTCTAGTPTCTGGTIANVTDTGVKLTNVQNVTLTRMRMNNSPNFGLNGSTVTGLTVDTCVFDGTHGSAIDEGALFVTNLFGSSAITNSEILGGFNDNVRINNTAAGTLNRLTVSGTTIRNSGNNHGLAFYTCLGGNGSTCPSVGTMNLTVTGSTFTDNAANSVDIGAKENASMDVVLQNNTFQSTTLDPVNGGNGAVLLSVDHSADMTFDVNGNNFQKTKLSAFTAFISNQTTSAASMTGKFRSNTIGTAGTLLSGSRQGSGMQVTATGAAALTMSITGNTIRNWASNNGMDISAGDGGATGPQVNLTVTGNTLNLNSATVNQLHGLSAVMGTTSTGGAVNACLDIGGAGALANNLVGAESGPSSGFQLRARQRNSSTVRLPGYAGSTTDTTAAINYLAGRNTVSAPASTFVSATVQSPPGGGFTGGAACTQPPIAPPAPEDGETSFAPESDRSGEIPATAATAVPVSEYLASIGRGITDLYNGLSEAVAPTARAEESSSLPSAAPFSGETVSVNGNIPGGFTLPAGKSVTIQFDAQIDANIPANDFSVSNQGTVSGSNFANVLTDDPSVAGAANPTVTTVVQPPTIAKAFGASFIAVNTPTTLTFTVGNPNPSQSFTNVAFSDTLPSGMVIATPNGLVNNCGGGTVTATQGTNLFSLSALSRAANSSCTIVVNVTASTEGAKNNTTGTIASTQGGTGLTASASVTALAAPTFTKSFGAPTIPLNSSTSLSFTITNNSATAPLNGVAFNDALPAGLIVATPPNQTGTCGGGTITATAGTGSIALTGATLAAGASCTFSVDVTGTTAGLKSNSVNLSTTELGAASATAAASVTVVAPPTIAKGFAPSTVLQNNGFSVLTLTITNPNAGAALAGVGVVDNFPTGLEVNTTPAATNSCGGTFAPTAAATSVTLSGGSIPAGGSCAVSVRVTGTASGTLVNTTQNVTSTNGGAGSTATANLTVTNTAVWNGATDSNWNTSTNWTPNVVPNSGNDVSIPLAGVTNSPIISASDVTVNSVTLITPR